MRPLGIISKRGRPYSPAMQRFVEFLTEKDARATTRQLLSGHREERRVSRGLERQGKAAQEYSWDADLP